jgi:hypothetical protein
MIYFQHLTCHRCLLAESSAGVLLLLLLLLLPLRPCRHRLADRIPRSNIPL